ncbi:hypothetical protein Tco_0717969 [Tanacetum coccineum]
MACSIPHSDDEIQALVQKQIDEDMVHQKAILDLALQFDNACTTKKDLRKAYEKCNHIPQESRALIDTFLKEGSDKDYELNLSMYRKAAKLEKQMNAKLAWIHEKYNHRSETGKLSFCDNGSSEAESHNNIELALVVFNAHASCSCAFTLSYMLFSNLFILIAAWLLHQTDWTNDVNCFFKWLSAIIEFSADGFRHAAIAEGTSSSSNVLTRHCILVAASNPDSRPPDAEKVAKSFPQSFVSLVSYCPLQLPKLRAILNRVSPNILINYGEGARYYLQHISGGTYSLLNSMLCDAASLSFPYTFHSNEHISTSGLESHQASVRYPASVLARNLSSLVSDDHLVSIENRLVMYLERNANQGDVHSHRHYILEPKTEGLSGTFCMRFHSAGVEAHYYKETAIFHTALRVSRMRSHRDCQLSMRFLDVSRDNAKRAESNVLLALLLLTVYIELSFA